MYGILGCTYYIGLQLSTGGGLGGGGGGWWWVVGGGGGAAATQGMTQLHGPVITTVCTSPSL